MRGLGQSKAPAASRAPLVFAQVNELGRPSGQDFLPFRVAQAGLPEREQDRLAAELSDKRGLANQLLAEPTKLAAERARLACPRRAVPHSTSPGIVWSS